MDRVGVRPGAGLHDDREFRGVAAVDQHAAPNRRPPRYGQGLRDELGRGDGTVGDDLYFGDFPVAFAECADAYVPHFLGLGRLVRQRPLDDALVVRGVDVVVDQQAIGHQGDIGGGGEPCRVVAVVAELEGL